jgi:2-hydroxychromene-2-carboxylate isomerase
MPEVECFYGLGSRYCYLAFTQLARLETTYHCRFDLQPISSVELMALRGISPFQGPPPSGQYDWAYRRRDAKAWADHYGVPFVEPRPLPGDHRLLARAAVAAGLQGALRRYSEALFHDLFVGGFEVDLARCRSISARLSLNVERFEIDMVSRRVDERVSEHAKRAHRRGAFGVPTFFVGERMFWGNDRLPLVEDCLRAGAAG